MDNIKPTEVATPGPVKRRIITTNYAYEVRTLFGRSSAACDVTRDSHMIMACTKLYQTTTPMLLPIYKFNDFIDIPSGFTQTVKMSNPGYLVSSGTRLALIAGVSCLSKLYIIVQSPNASLVGLGTRVESSAHKNLTLINSTFVLGLASSETHHHSSHSGPVVSAHSRTTAVVLKFRRGLLGGFSIIIDSRLFRDSETTVHIDPVTVPVQFTVQTLDDIGSTDAETEPAKQCGGGSDGDDEDEVFAISVLAGLLRKRRKLTLDQVV